MIRLYLDGHPPGGNERKRSHWTKLYQVDKQWKDAARLLALDYVNRARLAGLPYGQCVVDVVYHYPIKRERDWDNVTGQLKGVLDGLKGVIWVDDASSCIIELRQRIVVDGRDGIELLVEPVQESLL
jgi:Endodeoxyribonuclease RusA